MSDGFEECGKEQLWPKSRHCHGIYLQGLRNTMKTSFRITDGGSN
jgi:hypothetical protein